MQEESDNVPVKESPSWFFLGDGLVTFLLFIAVYGLYGFYYQTNDDLLFVLMIRGSLSPEPVTAFYDAHIFTANIYAFLYQYLPSVSWYGLFHYGAMALAFLFLLSIVRTFFTGKWQWVLGLLLSLLLFVWGFAPNLIWFNYTRPAILVAGIVLIFIHIKSRSSKIGIVYFFGWLLFVWALCTRPHAVYLVLALLFPVSLVLSLIDRKDRKRLMLCWLPILGISLLFFINDGFLKTSSQVQYEQKAEALFLNKSFGSEGAELSKRDSIIKLSLNNFMWADNELMSVESLRKIYPQKKYNLLDWQALNFHSAKETLWVRSIHRMPILSLLVLVFFLVLIFSYGNWRSILASVSLQLFFLVILFAVTVLIKMPDRLFLPMVFLWVIFSLYHLSVSISSDFYRKSVYKIGLFKKISIALLFLGFCFCSISSFNLENDSTLEAKSNLKIRSRVFDQINSLQGKTIVFTPATNFLLNDLNPLAELQLSPRNQYVFAFGWPSLFESHVAQMKEISGEGSFRKFIESVAGDSNVLFFSDEYAQKMLNAYCSEVFGQNLTWSRSEKLPDLQTTIEKQLYWIQSIGR